MNPLRTAHFTHQLNTILGYEWDRNGKKIRDGRGSFNVSSGMPEAWKLTSFAVKEPKIATRVALTIT